MINPFYSPSFNKWLSFTLEMEGGAFDDPRATHTNHGIRQDVYDAYCKEYNKPNKSVDGLISSEVTEFYYDGYWKHCDCDAIANTNLAGCVFDTAVNCGQRKAIEFFQEYMDLKVDGSAGPVTESAAKTVAPANDFACVWYIRRRKEYYKSIGDARFMKGWLARCDKLALACGVNLDEK